MPTVEQLRKQLFELGVLTLVTVIIWIGYGVYSALTQPSQTQVSGEQLKSVPTDLDLEQLDRLRNRVVIADDALVEFSESRWTIPAEPASPSPTSLISPSPAETTISTSSASPSASP